MTSSLSTLDQVYHWVKNVQGITLSVFSHGSWLPTRMLHIGTAGDRTWKLVLHTFLDPLEPAPRYITLSYWCGVEPQKSLLLSETFIAGQITN